MRRLVFHGPRRVFRALSVIVLSSGFAVAAAADDAALKARVEARLAKAKLDQRGDIAVAVQDGAVALEGGVLTLDARRQAEKLAHKEAKRVDNHLQVLPEPRSDAQLRKDAEAAILRYPYYGVFDSVGLDVADGVVTLRGSVLQPYRRQEIDERVARLAGVREIRNEIRVQPVSILDDRLRAELYRAIYSDARFAQYRDWPNPPVRIVVENGRVTLTGYVASPVEQALLGHIARGTLAFGVDNRVRLENEPPQEDRRNES